MGKSKRRILSKGIHQKLSTLSRQEAVNLVLKSTSKEELSNIIALFGLTPEELLEAGLGYEDLKEIESLF